MKTAVAPAPSPRPSGESAIGPVLLVTPWYRPVVGGVVEVAERLRRTLNEAGVESHLLVCDDASPRIRAHPAVPNVWYVRMPFYRPSLKGVVAMLVRAPGVLWRIGGFVRRHRVRTVILIYPSGQAWPFVFLRRVLGLRVVASCHGNDITRIADDVPLGRWVFRRALETADAITVCSNRLRRKAAELFPARVLPIRVIPNCVNLKEFMPAPPAFPIKDPRRPTLVHVSNFAPKKRTLDIVEAFAIAAIPSSSRLLMVGEGPDRAAAVERARQLGVDQRVEFVGAQKDVRPHLWQADLFVMASDDEGDPLALLEAMACGLPWVSPAWGAAAALPAGECGLVVPSRSPDALAAAIAALINDPQRRQVMGLRARYRAELELGEDKYLERHLQLIREVESAGSSRA